MPTALAEEVAKDGILVNAVAPSILDTPANRQAMPKADHSLWPKVEEVVRTTAFRNGTLQGAYLIMAARALGLDCGPMSGFDNAAVDADFFAGEPNWKSNFICSIGYGDPASIFGRSPRPDFDTFNRIL
jgi:nitroreductase